MQSTGYDYNALGERNRKFGTGGNAHYAYSADGRQLATHVGLPMRSAIAARSNPSASMRSTAAWSMFSWTVRPCRFGLGGFGIPLGRRLGEC